MFLIEDFMTTGSPGGYAGWFVEASTRTALGEHIEGFEVRPSRFGTCLGEGTCGSLERDPRPRAAWETPALRTQTSPRAITLAVPTRLSTRMALMHEFFMLTSQWRALRQALPTPDPLLRL
jgi:hypothetical protein